MSGTGNVDFAKLSNLASVGSSLPGDAKAVDLSDLEKLSSVKEDDDQKESEE